MVGMGQRQGLKRVLDVARYYARPDVFELWVHTGERPLIEAMSTPAGLVGADPAAQKPGQT